MESKACGKSSCKPYPLRNHISWLPAVFIAILPKCPFCIMAYAGAVSMCSGKEVFPNLGSYFSYIIIAISTVIIASLWFNRKGRKTKVALVIATAGIALIVVSQFFILSEPLYYIGTALMFFGIWYNGSFHYWKNRFIKKISFKYNSIKTLK